MSGFDWLFTGISIIAGAVAAIAGFGIGSILTPLLALKVGTKTAVAVTAVPHFIGTVTRFWIIRSHVDRKVLLGFGVASAAGGLAGAFLHEMLESNALTLVFGVLLVFAGFIGFTGLAQKIRFSGTAAWVAGALSGGLGGLVGNQGGIRSAALLAFDLPKESLIATATAIGVAVDIARLPVYLVSEHRQIFSQWAVIVTGTGGVVAGTWFGVKLLERMPKDRFRKALSFLVFALGIYMIVKATGFAGIELADLGIVETY